MSDQRASAPIMRAEITAARELLMELIRIELSTHGYDSPVRAQLGAAAQHLLTAELELTPPGFTSPCPDCGSTNSTRDTMSNETILVCDDCGHWQRTYGRVAGWL